MSKTIINGEEFEVTSGVARLDDALEFVKVAVDAHAGARIIPREDLERIDDSEKKIRPRGVPAAVVAVHEFLERFGNSDTLTVQLVATSPWQPDAICLLSIHPGEDLEAAARQLVEEAVDECSETGTGGATRYRVSVRGRLGSKSFKLTMPMPTESKAHGNRLSDIESRLEAVERKLDALTRKRRT